MQFKQEKNSMFNPGGTKAVIAFFIVLIAATLLFKESNHSKNETAEQHGSDLPLD